jgi:ubiquinol-cytochrome c reductase cytochrome b subunit
MYLWPWIEARRTGDRREHHVLDRPRDRPVRTGIGVAAVAFFTVLGFAGSDDVLAVAFGLSVNALVWTFRVALVVVPLGAGLLAARICVELGSMGPPPASR